MKQQRRKANRRGHAMAALGLAALLGGCAEDVAAHFDASKPLFDGGYSAESSPDEQGGKGVISITVAGGRIAAVQFHGVNADGSVKDESYGTDSSGNVFNQEYYAKAQFAVAAFDTYALELLEVGNPTEVDVIAGATWAYEQFLEAAIAALEQAQAGLS